MKLGTYTKTETVQAMRITATNRTELSATIDAGDGSVRFADIGDWLVVEGSGNQIYPDGDFRRNFKKA